MQSIIHRFNRLYELGPRNSLISMQNKIARKLFHTRWRSQALARTAHHSWAAIAQNHCINKNFSEYWHKASLKSLPNLPSHDINTIIAQADAYTHNQFDILGSGPHKFSPMPWHQDIRLKAQNPHADHQFDAQSFYKDIKIHKGTTSDTIKDIKVPWELSRCQHLPILGMAYQETNAMIYADVFTLHITSWLDDNPYLLGINWLCPMEVAIRAINWIWAWHQFKNGSDMSPAFWERFICSLYDHMHYLENNWEIFDTKTSNHYLSDLLGYLYLCWFFQDLPGIDKKRDWCIKDLLKESERQVFEEGTDYESSTAYHCLVTEIFDHMALLCSHMIIPLPATFHAKLDRMHEFIAWCTINDKDMVKIGDDDSGRITHFRPLNPSTSSGRTGTKHYPNFGLSIIKTSNWHITLRHHAYSKRQPSAHFHNDALSFTLAIDEIPIIIDPGSYLYTASSLWRNHFRSVNVHNALYIEGHEPIPFDDRLFALNIPENKNSSNSLSSSHNLYSRFNITLHRSLEWDDAQTIITDQWHGQTKDLILGWNFTLHPAIEIAQENNQWILSRNNKPLAALESTLNFQLHETWMSPEYGVKVKSLSLKASYSERLGKESKILFIKL